MMAAPTDERVPGASRPAETTEVSERLDRLEGRRDGFLVLLVALTSISLITGVVAVGFGVRAIDESDGSAKAARRSASLAVAVSSHPGFAGAAPAGPAIGPIAVTVSSYSIRASATIIAPGKVTFNIVNAGLIEHELLVFRTEIPPSDFPTDRTGRLIEDATGMNKISDGDNIKPGSRQARIVDLSQPGTYVLVCNIAKHFSLGMHLVITVKAPSA